MLALAQSKTPKDTRDTSDTRGTRDTRDTRLMQCRKRAQQSTPPQKRRTEQANRAQPSRPSTQHEPPKPARATRAALHSPTLAKHHVGENTITNHSSQVSSRGKAAGSELREGKRPMPPLEREAGEWAHDWQFYASSASEHHFRSPQTFPWVASGASKAGLPPMTSP